MAKRLRWGVNPRSRRSELNEVMDPGTGKVYFEDGEQMFPKSDKNEFTLIEKTLFGRRRGSVVQVFERGCTIPPDFDADPRTGWLNDITFDELLNMRPTKYDQEPSGVRQR